MVAAAGGGCKGKRLKKWRHVTPLIHVGAPLVGAPLVTGYANSCPCALAMRPAWALLMMRRTRTSVRP